MANIDLLQKYRPTMESGFMADSYTLSKVATDWEFSEANIIKIKSYVMEDGSHGFGTGPKSGGNRLGTPTDIEDEVQILELGMDTYWTKSLNYSDQARGSLHEAAAYMKERNNTVDMPYKDAYNLRKWALNAGKVIDATAAVAKGTIIEDILDLETEMDEKNVPQEARWCYCPVKYRKFVRLADEWDACDGIINNMVIKGWEGSIGSMKMVFVPSALMPANIELLATYQGSVIAPQVYKLARILKEQQGYPGDVLEYLDVYDAFVKGKKNAGVVALTKYNQSAKAATPTIGNPSGSTSAIAVTLTSSGSTVYYTLDGSDPRWSKTALSVSSGSSVTIGQFTGTLKAYAKNETAGSEKYPSDIASQSYTNGAKS